MSRPPAARAGGDAPAALAVVLHTHMPYVEGFGTWPFGEEWLWEAIACCYLPLLDVLDAAPGRVTLSVTPVLGGRFIRVDYTWGYQGKPQEGALLVGFDPKSGEVSGHWHPKLCLPGFRERRRCFLIDARRVVMPAYGTYTGGLDATHPPLRALFGPRALAVLTGAKAMPVPLPPAAAARRG